MSCCVHRKSRGERGARVSLGCSQSPVELPCCCVKWVDGVVGYLLCLGGGGEVGCVMGMSYQMEHGVMFCDLWCSASGSTVSVPTEQIGKRSGCFFPCGVDGRKRLFQEQVALILFLFLALKSLNLFITGPQRYIR